MEGAKSPLIFAYREILVLKYRPIWHSKYDVPVSSTPIGFVKFLSGGTYPEHPGGPDEIEVPGDKTVWLWPDGERSFASR